MISLADLQRRIDAGELSADAAIAQSREAIGAHETSIGAFVCHDPNARAQGAGPLRGIAVGIKDIMDTADFPTEMGDERVEGAWADVVAADQPQSVDPVGLGEVGRELGPVVHADAASPNLRLRSTRLIVIGTTLARGESAP